MSENTTTTTKKIGRPKRGEQKPCPVTTNVDEEAKRALQAIAREQGRSMANLIDVVLMAYIAEWREKTTQKAD